MRQPSIFLLACLFFIHCDQPQKAEQAPASLPPQTAVPAAPVEAGPNMFWEAALKGNAEAVKKALDQGMPVDAQDPDGRTALMLAAFDGHTALVNTLLQAAAKPDIQDASGRTALMYSASGDNAETVRLLLEHGASPNLIDGVEKWTALMFAAAEGQVEVVQLLLDNGADPNMADIDGETSLYFAEQNKHLNVVRMLEAAN